MLGRIRKEAELSRIVDGLDIGSKGERSSFSFSAKENLRGKESRAFQ